MTNLAEEAILVLLRTVAFSGSPRGNAMGFTVRAQPPSVMREVVMRRIYNCALSESHEFISELEYAERLVTARMRVGPARNVNQRGYNMRVPRRLRSH